MRSRAWLALDAVGVAAFAVVGGLTHHDSWSLGGWWAIAWPFLAGLLLGWAVLLLARRTGASVVGGIVVWLAALVGGMALRQADGQGTAAPFVVVAALVLGALLVLPRVVAVWGSSLRR